MNEWYFISNPKTGFKYHVKTIYVGGDNDQVLKIWAK